MLMNKSLFVVLVLALSASLPLLAAENDAKTGVPVVLDGRPAAVVVLPEPPTPVTRYAAQELVYHVEKATGVRLSVVAETVMPRDSEHRIYLGNCRATRDAAIQTAALPPEAFVLRTTGKSLFIAGEDTGGDPLEPETRAGTLYGTYEWLEQVVRVRWLWPGELGTWVPRTRTVLAPVVDQVISPSLFQRRVRPGLGLQAQNPALGFTPKAFQQYSQDQTVFLRRHRMGRSIRMSYGHAFTDWWEKYGREHPEWFQLLPDGRRGPAKRGARYSMCVSDPGFQREIVARWQAAGGEKVTQGPSFINAVENDILGLCTCERCKSWDGPTPPDYLKFYSSKSKVAGSRFVSDRYARFWLAVQQEAARVNPRATVIGYIYFNYFQAPTSEVKLNPNILLGYCPSGGWYPRSAEEQDWYQRQWRGWRDTGARLFSRTNYFLDGYCMPFIFAHQFADDFQHAARNGMVATDFDSLTGQWSTQGPNLYLLMRLHTRPGASADDLLAEYYGGFGAAAPEVKAYFDYWERYTMARPAQINQTFEKLEASRWRTWARAAHEAFPLDCFAPGEAILARASGAVMQDPEASARVEFLRKGLQHARLCSRTAAVLSLARAEAPEAERKKALHELLTFRRSVERDGISNFNQLAWVEDLSWKLPAEARQPAELYP
jgi:uncharacterized protein DUF4838